MNRDKMQRQGFILRNKKTVQLSPPKPVTRKGVVKIEPFSSKKSTTTSQNTKEKLLIARQTLQMARAKRKTTGGCGGCRRRISS